MNKLLSIAKFIDAINHRFGQVANWMVLAACLISAGNALVRYGFDRGSNAWLEVQWYLFAGMVMLGAAHTLRLNAHVRVDVVYGRLAVRTRAWIDLLGFIFFLLPVTIFLTLYSWPVFSTAWQTHEMSANAGGLLLWPAKLAMPLGFGLLVLQGVAEVIKRIAYLRGELALDLHYEKPAQ